ncbi:uncharacterized protein LOC134527292 [Bacillus rossius redtenbacheri]|uniref:uncharacterized protein LOC134527292 n=1 Tax=Bacillus rossius redtenbacheri TaxID=93214 RepID=UPI002FDC9759
MTELGNHNPDFGCSLNNLKCVNEIRHGLWSVIVLECNMCNGKFSIQTQDPDTSSSHMDINSRAVAGIMSVGGGFSHLQEICASIGMPSMYSKTYSVIHDKICDGWEKAAIKEMQDAAKEEAELAVERGDVDENGTPLLTVAVDGCWSKRSYRTHYNAPSGVAAIVGFYTKKVLFMSVRNKFCYVCARSTSGEDIPKHACYKIWSGSSTSMEANIILEGFQQSEALYNVKYSKMIADGDSSCYKKILEARPYANLTVEKIECRNHLLRNYCTKLRNLSEQHRIGSSSQRKLLLQKILKLRRAVTEAVKHRKSEEMSLREKIALLQADILNGPSHVFGDHSKCCQYFCSGPKEGEKNIVPELKMSELYEHIMKAVKYLAYNSRSLIHDVDSNVVEQFNSIIAKIVGGKRINYALKRSYQGRCSAAVVSHNTKKPHYVLHKTLCDGFSPNKFVKKLELSRLRKREETGSKGKRVKCAIIMKRSKSENPSGLGDANYGPNCERPDMTPDLFQVEKKNLLKSLEKTVEERREIERATLLQAGSGEWLERRRKMLTASKFGRICRRRATTSCKALVKNIIYSSSISSVPAIAYGKKNESIALEQLERQENLVIQQCGLFIDEQLPFLGATPDGLIGEHGLVEIKCPSSAAGIDVDKAVSDGKLGYLMCNDQNKVTRLKTNHDYYYQVQGQLHITNRKFALFAIWTSKDIPIKVVTVQKDDQFWKEKMEKQLTRFYFDCMVPELVDPRYTRNMEIRDPEYIRHIPCKKKGKVSASKNSKDIIMQ